MAVADPGHSWTSLAHDGLLYRTDNESVAGVL
jgi:hypothetical protein